LFKKAPINLKGGGDTIQNPVFLETEQYSVTTINSRTGQKLQNKKRELGGREKMIKRGDLEADFLTVSFDKTSWKTKRMPLAHEDAQVVSSRG
jgi:hypothetical protein